jgi:preprotein translocase subunit SecF
MSDELDPRGTEPTEITAEQDVDLVEASPAKPDPAKKVSFAHRLWTGEISFDFIGHARWWYILSGALLLIAILSLAIRGLDLGIEFRGGSNFKVNVPEVAGSTLDDFRQAVIESGVSNLDGTSVATIGSGRVSIETRALSVEEQVQVREAIAAQANTTSELVDYQQIGASWGQQVTRQAGIALVVFVLLVSLLIGFYFRDAKMALSAITALMHDVVITVGIYALVGFTVTPATLTGLLTILGYSLYDNVVVFDKVRENTLAMDDTKMTYAEAANHGVNQVLVRSINTTVIGVLPVAAILFAGAFILGSGPLEDIGLALFVGMIIGAYSSIFIATPLLVRLKMREPAMQQQAARVARRRERVAARHTEEEPIVPSYTVSTTTDLDEPLPTFQRRQPTRTSRSQRAKDGL